jgi:phosphoesterase RecJ-like protein
MKREIVDVLRDRKRFTIYSHVDPDGDALGSSLGLAWILRELGKEAAVRVPGGVPRMYRFLPGADEIRSEPGGPAPDVNVVVDATSASRLADLEHGLEPGVTVVNVDHHGDNARFGDYPWIDPTASATALMIFEMARAAGFAVPRAAAECLYVGILTDTGRFTFANTDVRTLAAAAELASLGADPAGLASQVYERVSPASVRLLGAALSTLELRDEGAIACLHVTRAMLEETGARLEDAEGFSTYTRSLVGVKVGIFLRETRDGAVKVSFRSNGGVEIDGVAARFGGGGHPRASGARVPGPLEEAKEAVLRAVSEHVRNFV